MIFAAFAAAGIVVTIIPLFAPIALLLKLKQIDFVESLPLHWSPQEWLRFLGFVNNIIALTATQQTEISSYERAFSMNQDLEKDTKEMLPRWLAPGDVTHFVRSIDVFIVAAVLENNGYSKGWLILNSWMGDPQKYLAFLRCAKPILEKIQKKNK